MFRTCALWNLLFVLFLLATPGAAHALRMRPPLPYRAKDFTLIKHDGVFHLFYIRNDTTLPIQQTESDLGHATSLDLYGWEHQPPVLAVRDTSWDDTHVWSPHIVEDGGVFYMFYTGVSEDAGVYAEHQRIGVATSTDLMTWNRYDEPVVDCGNVPWLVCDPLASGGGTRDAFVMRDPANAGRWLMLQTGWRDDLPGSMTAGIAATTAGLTTGWSGLVELDATHAGITGSDLVESPHMFVRNGTWYLLWTGNGAVPLRIATSPDPLASAASWTQRGTIANATGFSAPWIASEYLRDGLLEYFAFVYGENIEIRNLFWNADWTFRLLPPNAFNVVRMRWNREFVRPGQTVNLIIESVNWRNQTMHLEGVEIDAGGEELLPLAQMGMPASVPILADTMTIGWVVPNLPDVSSDGVGAEVVFRTVFGTAPTPQLTILPAIGNPAPDPPGGDPTGGSGGGESGDGFKLAFLPRSPLGPHGGFLIELREETHVRLDVFDIQGRRVRSLADRTLPSGATVVAWDERAATGARLSSGVYFVRLRANQQVRTARVFVSP